MQVPDGARSAELQSSRALQTAAFFIFHEGILSLFPNTQSFQTREPDTIGDLGLNITGISCLNDYFFTSVWIHFLWSMTTVYSRVLETIRRHLIFDKQ